MNQGLNRQVRQITTKQRKKNAVTGIVIGAIALIFGAVLAVTGMFFYIDASVKSKKSQAKEFPFDPWETGSSTQESYKTINAIGLTYDFAVDFKETYHYYFAFDEEGHSVIVKMKGDLEPEYQELVDFMFGDESMEVPELVRIRGVAAAIEDDIREFAIEYMNELYDEEFLNQENFELYLGQAFLDTTIKPMGHGDYSVGSIFLGLGFGFLAISLFLLVFNIRGYKAAVLAEEKEKMLLSQMSTYFSDAPSPNVGETADLQTVIDKTAPPEQENELQKIIQEPKEEKKGNVFLGLIGAIGGSLIGVALWLLIGMVGFIAGIAGFVMLKFALLGYQKLSGKLDKKGAVISLFVAAFMVFGANVLEFVIGICKAYFEYEASFDTVWFVVTNFVELMTDYDMWRGFWVNLVIGYGLSIWSSFSLIGSILRYKEK